MFVFFIFRYWLVPLIWAVKIFALDQRVKNVENMQKTNYGVTKIKRGRWLKKSLSIFQTSSVVIVVNWSNDIHLIHNGMPFYYVSQVNFYQITWMVWKLDPGMYETGKPLMWLLSFERLFYITMKYFELFF